MAILFRPNRPNTILNPSKTAELLQGFMNIQEATNVKDGRLTEANLDKYNRITWFVPDVNTKVADYFTRNFHQIAPLDGEPNSISVDDLVIRRPELSDSTSPFSPSPLDIFGESASSRQVIYPDEFTHHD